MVSAGTLKHATVSAKACLGPVPAFVESLEERLDFILRCPTLFSIHQISQLLPTMASAPIILMFVFEFALAFCFHVPLHSLCFHTMSDRRYREVCVAALNNSGRRLACQREASTVEDTQCLVLDDLEEYFVWHSQESVLIDGWLLEHLG